MAHHGGHKQGARPSRLPRIAPAVIGRIGPRFSGVTFGIELRRQF